MSAASVTHFRHRQNEQTAASIVERRHIARELDTRACQSALWMAIWAADRAEMKDLQAELSALWARCSVRLRALEQA